MAGQAQKSPPRLETPSLPPPEISLRTVARDRVGPPDGERDGVAVLDVPVVPLSLNQAVRRIRAMVHSARPHQVVLANAHTVNCAYSDPVYRRTLQRAAMVLRDGVGLEMAGALSGHRMRHNFVGTDFIPLLLDRLAEPEVSVFLYGARPGVAAAAAQALRKQIAGLRVAGLAHGYESSVDVIARVKTARPQVLLVALGNPLQEQWIGENLELLQVPVAIGVGALFDYLAERIPRAPRWLRRLRGEWLFRLAVEPQRLWRRYIIGNTQFLWRVLTQVPGRDRPIPPATHYGRQ